MGTHENYGAWFEGSEVTTIDPCPQRVRIREFSVGVEIPYFAGLGFGIGKYNSTTDSGWFFFISGGAVGQHGAVGGGFSF